MHLKEPVVAQVVRIVVKLGSKNVVKLARAGGGGRHASQRAGRRPGSKDCSKASLGSKNVVKLARAGGGGRYAYGCIH